MLFDLFLFRFPLSNCRVGTNAGAGPALNTCVGIDTVVPVVLLDGFRRADLPTGSADNTVFSYKISHDFLLCYISTSPVEILAKFSTINGTRL